MTPSAAQPTTPTQPASSDPGVGAGYRWVTGVEGDIPNRSDGDARGAALGVQLTAR